MKLGAHESIVGGLHKAFERAKAVGCEALQLFVKSSRSWQAKALTEEEISLFRKKATKTGIFPVIGHASYLINLAAPQDDLWQKSIRTLITELERCEALGISYLVLHPGAHTGQGETEGLKRIAQAIGQVHDTTRGFSCKILLETTAGQGTALGYKFEHIAWLLENSPQAERLGICLDTCHIFAAGYDLRTPEAYEATMNELDALIGLDKVRVIHLNDSRGALGSRIDRHEHIGKGELGLEAFRLILKDPRFSPEMPALIETPKSEDLHEDRENLAVLRSLQTSMPQRRFAKCWRTRP